MTINASEISLIVGCESSGVVREAFRRLGFDAWSCDIQAADDGSKYHLQCDLKEAALSRKWTAAILHPPCTRLTNSGVRWLAERNLWDDLKAGADFFRFCLEFPADFVAVENPIQHSHARNLIKAEYDQLIQPWQFGHGETKATCLWLKNLPPLMPTNIVEGREARIHNLPPSADRWKIRSKTYDGIAEAMANQWGNWILSGKTFLRRQNDLFEEAPL